MRNKTIELLAPAGTWEALEAAVYAGADAVYLGGTAFGARQYAENFGEEELGRAVVFAHLHRVRLYVTVNTLVDDSEMESLGSYLVFLNNIGVDGIIVQDMGVVRLARLVVPDLPLHASTQMTITNSEGVAFAYSLGMERMVLARECSLEDIRKICAATPAEIEVFIHGALCVCYSGQCLMSSLIGGRSGNRGRCAQPCRLPYSLVNADGQELMEGLDAGQYLLSPKDLNTLDILPELIEAGVVSYKIEGRMKRPEYVAVVVDIYRRAIDSYLSGKYVVSDVDRRNIEQIFNRDFTTAYLDKRPGRTMMSDRRPNNRGVLVGRVTKLYKENGRAAVKLEKALHNGDGLEFWVSVGGRIGTTLEDLELDGKKVSAASAGQQVTLSVPKGVRLNDRIFRTYDAELMEFAGQFFGEEHKKRLPVHAEVIAELGKALRLTLSDEEGNCGSGYTDFVVEQARKHPLDEAIVQKQLERLGTTEYVLKSLALHADANVMVPISELNEARRRAVAELDKARIERFAPVRRQRKWQTSVLEQRRNHTLCKHSQLVVEVDTLPKAQAALEAGADWLIAAGDTFTLPLFTLESLQALSALTHSKGKKWALGTPRIVSEKELAYYKQLLSGQACFAPDALMIANNGLWLMAKSTGLFLWLDFALNQYNGQALLFWQEEGAVGAVLSPELTMAQVAHLAQFSPLQLECLVQGPLEMMVSEYCVTGSFLGNLHSGKCSFACRQEAFLKDRKGEVFPLKQDGAGRTHILNGHDLSMLANVRQLQEAGISRLRIDARSYDAEKTAVLVDLYRQVLDSYKEVTEHLPHTTRGHYFRGVL